MGPIKTLFVINHSHTDIGFTDFQDVCFRQHREFIEQALDLIEATADYPEDARYRWVCETTGPLERYLRNASAKQIDRFQRWRQKGAIDIAGMQYNLTPLLNLEQMYRSLYPVRRLRENYGLAVRSAMQDDVNGISWGLCGPSPGDWHRLPDPGGESHSRWRTQALPQRLLVGGASGRPHSGLEWVSLSFRP
jgi:alpha-mannosidase